MNAPAPPEGLCAVCIHCKRIPHPRGGRGYIYCKLSETDPNFRRYPALPVIQCTGFKPQHPEPLDE